MAAGAEVEFENEALPEFARHFKATYVATECYSDKFSQYRLVQCHFNIPITHLRKPTSFNYVASKITNFLTGHFGLHLPVQTIQHGYFELCAVPLLHEIGQDGVDLPDSAMYFKGSFNLSNGKSSLLWPRQKLESKEGIASSLRLALDEDNIQKAMLDNYLNSNWLFIRMAAVICVCVFLDSFSQHALRALKRPQSYLL